MCCSAWPFCHTWRGTNLRLHRLKCPQACYTCGHWKTLLLCPKEVVLSLFLGQKWQLAPRALTLAIARPPLKGIARTFVQRLLVNAVTVRFTGAHLWLIYPVGHSRQGIYYPHKRRLNEAQNKCIQVAMSGIVLTPKRGRSTCSSSQSSHLFGNLTTAYLGALKHRGFCGGAWGTMRLTQHNFCQKSNLCDWPLYKM